MNSRVDILIKSYNRPYYLDRCIQSIHRFVEGNYLIKILDDGTGPEYLDRILAAYPDVEIYRSPFYETKVNELAGYINGGGDLKTTAIPSDFWVKMVWDSTDVFLLTEDDIWFTSKFNIEEMANCMNESAMVFLRLFWQGNDDIVRGKKLPACETVEQVIPQLPISSSIGNKIILRNKFKAASILRRLNLIKSGFYNPYWSMYSVAGAMFRKDYWLHLWKDSRREVDEGLQLFNALDWTHKYPNTKFAKLNAEVMKTSYISSATNKFSEVQFDVQHFNHHISRAWLAGKFDAMENFPADFSAPYVKRHLSDSGDVNASYDGWMKWVELFKDQYRRIGCVVD